MLIADLTASLKQENQASLLVETVNNLNGYEEEEKMELIHDIVENSASL